MVYVTVVLTTSEWQRIARAASTLWPATEVDRQISRGEVCRQLALSGIERLLSASTKQREQALEEVARPLQPRGDFVMPALPGAK